MYSPIQHFLKESRHDAGLKFNLGMSILFAQTAGWGSLALASVAIGLKCMAINPNSGFRRFLLETSGLKTVTAPFLDKDGGRIFTQATLLIGTAIHGAATAVDWPAVAAGDIGERAKGALVLTGFVSGTSHLIQAPFLSQGIKSFYSSVKQTIVGRAWTPTDRQKRFGLATAETGLGIGLASIGVNAGMPVIVAFSLASIGATVSVRRALRSNDDPRNDFGAYFWAYAPMMGTAGVAMLSSLFSTNFSQWGINPVTWLREDPNLFNAASRGIIISGIYDLVHDTINNTAGKNPNFRFSEWAKNDPILGLPQRGISMARWAVGGLTK